MNFLPIIILCVISGVAFASLATWLSTTKGNTMRDILRSDKLKDLEPLRVELLNSVKLSSGMPIVALYVVAFACAFALPAFIVWTSHEEPIHVTGNIRTEAVPLRERAIVVPLSNVLTPDGSFKVPLLHSHEVQMFTVQAANFQPVTFSVTLDLLRGKATVESASLNWAMRAVDFDGQTVSLPKESEIKLVASNSLTPDAVANVATPRPTVNADFASISSPPGPSL